MNAMTELFEDYFKDIYNAEKQLSKALPKLAKAAKNPKLKEALQNHLEETKEQIRRLEEAGKEMGLKPTGMVCKGMQGIVAEAEEHLGEAKPGPVCDALIVGLAQKGEHYEICGYGTAIEYGKLLGHTAAGNLLEQNPAAAGETEKGSGGR